MNSRPVPQSYYDLLGVSPSASPEAIEQAFRARVREVRDLPGGGDRTHQLSIAYRALKTADKRRNYDADLAGTPQPRVERPTSRAAFVTPSAAAATLPPLAAARATGGAAASSLAAPPRAPAEAAPRNIPSEAVRPPEVMHTPPPPADAPPQVQSRPEQASPVREEAFTRHQEIPLQEKQTTFHEDAATQYRDDHPDRDYVYSPSRRPQRRRNGVFALAALIGVGLLALLLLIGRNTAPSPTRAPPAQADAGTAQPRGTQPSAEGELASASPQAEGGLLSDILDSIDPSREAAPPSPPAADAAEGVAEGGREVAATNEQPQTGEVTEELVEVASRADDEPAAEELAEAPTETAAASPVPPPASAPRPAPRVSRAAPARYLGGGLVDADNAGGRFAGSVALRFTVLPNGRTAGCRVTRSSGNSALDSTTCNLLQQRLRFTPALDEEGRPTVSEVGSVYSWGRTPGRRR